MRTKPAVFLWGELTRKVCLKSDFWFQIRMKSFIRPTWHKTCRLLKEIPAKIFTYLHLCCLTHLTRMFGIVSQVLAQVVLFMCMNTAGIFISYLSDRAQRQAFLETRRCVEARLRLETENQRQVPNAKLCLRCHQDSLSILSQESVFLPNTSCFASVLFKSQPWDPGV